MPTISVIIPAYNAEKTIQETIESVLNQTFQDFELIIINDGSTDKTGEIISGFTDARIQVFTVFNSGAPRSRNIGFAKSSAKYIAFLDADDLWIANKLELQYKALQQNPEAAVAYSWTDYIDESSHFLYAGFHKSPEGDIYPLLLVKNYLENGSNPLIARQALSEIGGFDESLSGGQDWDLYLRLAARYKFVAVPQVQILYRLSPNSMSSNILQQESACLLVLSKAFSNAPISLQPIKKQSLSHLYFYLMLKALQKPLTRQKGMIAARYFRVAIYYDPGLLKRRSRLMSILFVKIAATLVLSPQTAKIFLNRVKHLWPDQT
ncbi:glycosyltransferase [Laspinema olomoucense]|uniref:Glycosyltransferase n=1 Tax=Laspinema olomoucense D3b TaxID=2953688 RepID=A0ABT2NC59_9CYAN|nr:MULTISPECIES: glycosyltransferase [unclassified Laspinema]MCT7970472.1 glycosyltransferase [Laspinema sp. D3d]MCT7980284.1 glycosyltransferase [Laspinema sp. D3b]MCT7988530.1 glycosyltransferase [Laspinema sp. D3a]